MITTKTSYCKLQERHVSNDIPGLYPSFQVLENRRSCW